MLDTIKAKLKAFVAWLYNWITVVSGIVLGGLSMLPDFLDAIGAINLTPILPPAYAAKIITAIAVVKAVAAFIQSRKPQS